MQIELPRGEYRIKDFLGLVGRINAYADKVKEMKDVETVSVNTSLTDCGIHDMPKIVMSANMKAKPQAKKDRIKSSWEIAAEKLGVKE